MTEHKTEHERKLAEEKDEHSPKTAAAKEREAQARAKAPARPDGVVATLSEEQMEDAQDALGVLLDLACKLEGEASQAIDTSGRKGPLVGTDILDQEDETPAEKRDRLAKDSERLPRSLAARRSERTVVTMNPPLLSGEARDNYLKALKTAQGNGQHALFHSLLQNVLRAVRETRGLSL